MKTDRMFLTNDYWEVTDVVVIFMIHELFINNLLTYLLAYLPTYLLRLLKQTTPTTKRVVFKYTVPMNVELYCSYTQPLIKRN